MTPTSSASERTPSTVVDGKSLQGPATARGFVREHMLACYVVVVCLGVAAMAWVFALNGGFAQGLLTPTDPPNYSEWFHHQIDQDQYARLGDALLHGHTYLDLPVADGLAELENPYAFGDRYEIGSPDNLIYWDHAFKDGRYYSYFGVVPAVLVFMPYQFFTGSWLSVPPAVMFLGTLSVVAGGFLVWQVRRRFFEDAGLGALTLAFGLYLLSINLTYLLQVTWFYSIPIASSLAATAAGLGLWVSARRKDGSLSCLRIAAGSTLMALNLGCRPQFILVSALAIPLFWHEIFVERTLFSARGVWASVAAIAPYAVVFTPLLAYNYVRFGSLLDFGSNYNLTGFDMTTYRQRYILTGWLMGEYLFALPNAIGQFPFLVPMDTINDGVWEWAPNEPFYAGYLWLKPIVLAAVSLPFFARDLRRRRLGAFCLMAAVLMAVVMFVDTRTAGITERYFSDFGFYFGVLGMLGIFLIAERLRSRVVARRVVGIVAGVSIVASLLVAAWLPMDTAHYRSYAQMNPSLYESVRGRFE